MKYLLITLNICFASIVWGQDKYTSDLEDVKASGFKKVLLDSKLIGNATTDLRDLRLYDKQRQEIPYYIEKEERLEVKKNFHTYQILINEQKGKETVIMLHNPNLDTIQDLSVQINNASVKKHMTLLGSDDKVRWFVVKQRSVIRSINNQDDIYEMKLLHFPKVAYEYLRINIDDSTSLPIKVNEIGYYTKDREKGKYNMVTDLTWSQYDSVKTKQTVVKLNFGQHYRIDQLDLKFEGEPYFYRKVALCKKQVRQFRKREKEIYFQHLRTFYISSDAPNEVFFDALLVDDLYLLIENEDNPSIQLKSAEVKHLSQYLVANLKDGTEYSLSFGDNKKDRPRYDIDYFKNSISDDVPVIGMKEITKIDVEKKKLEDFFQQKTWIWLGLGIAGIVMVFISLNMLKEMKNEEA